MSTVYKSCKFRFNLLNYGKNTLPEIAHKRSLYICINVLFNLLASLWKIIEGPFSFCCVIPPLETLPPPGNPSGGVVYLRIVLSPEEASLIMSVTEHCFFFRGEELLAPRPTPKLEDHP
jgi:hypothetical protein